MYFTTISGLAIGLIALGTFLLAGGTAVAYGSYEKKEDAIAAAKADKAVYLQNIIYLEDAISNFQSYLLKLIEAEGCFKRARQHFANGGYIIEGKPLGDAEFSQLFSNISSAKTAINAVITELHNSKVGYEKAIAECNKVISQ